MPVDLEVGALPLLGQGLLHPVLAYRGDPGGHSGPDCLGTMGLGDRHDLDPMGPATPTPGLRDSGVHPVESVHERGIGHKPQI